MQRNTADKQNGFEGKIVVVSEESSVPYDRTKLSKALVDDETKLQWRTAEELKNDFKVDYKSSTVSATLRMEGQTNMVVRHQGRQISQDRYHFLRRDHQIRQPSSRTRW
jgi:hypothetical protein